jgi:pSer/pThr/pTyr-binding forkhead associated (FHA) protein
MDEPLAVALKFGFLAVLYLFLLWVSRSALRDLARSQEPVLADPVDAPRRGEDSPGGLLQHVNPRLEVIAAGGYEPGTTFDVSRGATLGRADTADIRVDDSFASSAHARVFERNDFMNVEDLASTNGTYLNGRKLVATEQLRVGDVIRIGDSEYRYEE